jgi:hypothetical protein
MPATNTQVAPAQQAGRPQPQTTIQPPGGPFIRYAQAGRKQLYDVTGTAFGGLVTQPLQAVPGYMRAIRCKFVASGGSGTSNVAAAADAPYSAVSLLTLRDAFGDPLIVGPGWEILKAVPKYGSQFGLHALSDVGNLPSFSAVATGASASGAFTFQSVLPLEFVKGIGVVSGANAALLPTLNVQYGAASSVFTTAPSTANPTIELATEADFYWLPEGAAGIQPPGLGTTCQWVMQQGNPTVGSASTATVAFPRMGGFLHSIILILRDSTNARIDQFGTRLRLYVDGVPLWDTLQNTLIDDMQISYAGVGSGAGNSQWQRDTGVLAWSRKRSLGQESMGLFDTGEEYLSTNPGTLLQVECSPWGTISNAPAVLNVLVGQVVPSGSLIQGLPEL